ncbi:uncharacterized protein RCC_05958 [Ramularia collo-cygni]|uniref:Alpha-1,2-mannosidase n=1 Tax=Ramularia collo-cygni TaxID=112498 RepID=A0A2D3UU73_9PEZI|nr:uncharacterized protein RCC_05958 [Ramularia collo-cygni]CZT20101.1 uncharacterized protein RCC_05958 [Ramularia collo-cygni]
MILPSSSVQKLLFLTIVAIVGIMLVIYHRLCCFSGIVTTAAASSVWHDNVGVLRHVNPKIGTYGVTPNGNGGMIPSVCPPFGMTRWTPQTRENFISQCPYNDMDGYIHGFQATHQPAIWMGESGQVVLSPGVGEIKPLFVDRAHKFRKEDEISTPYVYEVTMNSRAVTTNHNLTESIYSPVSGGAQPVPEEVSQGANGRIRRRNSDQQINFAHMYADESIPPLVQESFIKVAMTATSHVGRLQVDFDGEEDPYIFIQATRQNWTGHIDIDPAAREVSGSNPQRQDYALGPLPASRFSGYFVSRFSESFSAFGVTHGGTVAAGSIIGEGENLGAYVRFPKTCKTVDVRTGVSFISIEQARKNLDLEAPESISFDQAVEDLKQTWLEKLARIKIDGVNATDPEHDPRIIWYTALFHALQYPSDFSEPTSTNPEAPRTFYSGYTDSVHIMNDSYYQSWSIWDTFRAEHSLLTLFAPERVNSMMRSLVRIYEWSGRLPMWANVVETNIMIGTHVDAVLANALSRNFTDFDIGKAWEGVRKNAFVPPLNDTDLLYYDREGYTPDEARAGLTTYMDKGYVANDRWSESASRTLDYAFDDHAAAIIASHAGDHETAQHLRARSKNYKNLYNPTTGFMEAKNDNGTWAGGKQGWTEGDEWIYTFNVMHDIPGLAALLGGEAGMKMKLDEYFNGGHNDHSNEPSHHAPYLYAMIGYPADTQRRVGEIAWEEYNATSAGLSGNEDLGQMSAWYCFSALGFYPVDSAGEEYIVGVPFFERVEVRFPVGRGRGEGEEGEEHTLIISAVGAREKRFVKGLRVDGVVVDGPVLRHGDVVRARRIEFDMAATPQEWGGRKVG